MSTKDSLQVDFDYNVVRRRCEEAMRLTKNPQILKSIAELLGVSLLKPARKNIKYNLGECNEENL